MYSDNSLTIPVVAKHVDHWLVAVFFPDQLFLQSKKNSSFIAAELKTLKI